MNYNNYSTKQLNELLAYLILPKSHTPEERFKFLYSHMSPHEEKILKSLTPKKLRQLHYWRVIANYLKWKKEYKCDSCNRDAKKNINVHHKDYRFKGIEYRSLDTLEVLCRVCHIKRHAKKVSRSDILGDM